MGMRHDTHLPRHLNSSDHLIRLADRSNVSAIEQFPESPAGTGLDCALASGSRADGGRVFEGAVME